MGFTLFDRVHVSWLVFVIIAVVAITVMYKRSNLANERRLQMAVWIGLLVLEVGKQLYLLITHEYDYWSPPLHLCGLGMFVIGWHVWKPNRTTATILYSLTLPGAAIALLFPGWANEPVGSFLHIHSFLFHLLLVLYVVMLLVTRQLELVTKDLWKAVLFLMIFVPLIYIYNQAFQTNFMFLNRPVKGTPLQWLYDAFGASGYLVSLAVVLFLLWVVLYWPIERSKRHVSK